MIHIKITRGISQTKSKAQQINTKQGNIIRGQMTLLPGTMSPKPIVLRVMKVYQREFRKLQLPSLNWMPRSPFSRQEKTVAGIGRKTAKNTRKNPMVSTTACLKWLSSETIFLKLEALALNTDPRLPMRIALRGTPMRAYRRQIVRPDVVVGAWWP